MSIATESGTIDIAACINRVAAALEGCKGEDQAAFAFLCAELDKRAKVSAAPKVSAIPKDTEGTLKLFKSGADYLRKNKLADFPMGVLEVNGRFNRFMDTDTDSAWIGFRIAMQAARKLTATAMQPMDTAPLDGTEVLLRVKMRAGIPHKYLVGHYMQGGHCIEDHPAIGAGWYFWNGRMFDTASEPDGWLALPLDEASPA